MKPIIATSRLIVRNWTDSDRALFHRINADDRVMEFFPFRRDQTASDAFLDWLREDIAERGFGFCATELKETGECIGFVGLHQTAGISSLPPGTVEIGWRLAPEFWGKGYVTEAAEAWLDFGFKTLGLEEIVSFAVWNNARSIAVMKRIGMRAVPKRDFDHPSVPDTHPHLKRHVFYRIARDEWSG
ncbi:GNAT family N-acetyltransferase [Chelativorans salis]|uniref:GNAT family N-acetyltransferase n=1 Tax=Chelativorans salis TaxID=2978478 RepID=A0ABT2LNT7_9HYPH|nr:GNAT family N-acetyltransferase [Chelativorans sp. EGI FJ00035]MCT7375063.1 GNAT family N-acetyltransferase [Chelativorans sp. EGI FJ00035]